MTEKDLNTAEAECKRFLARVALLRKRIKEDPNNWHYGSRLTGAVKRSSMDVSQAMVELRKTKWE